MTVQKIEKLKVQFKGKGRILPHALKYLNDNYFFVNKQFDNKNFCVVTTTEQRRSESVAGLFKTKKVAIEFGNALGLKQIAAPV
jgi:hypothetical protein